jgi:hypothetical protein
MSQDSPLRQSGGSVRQALTAYRDLVRRESDAIRQEDSSELATAELSPLVYRVSGKSTREIDHPIDGLKDLRKKLDNDGNRVHRECGIRVLEPISNSTDKDYRGRHDSGPKSLGCSEHKQGGAQFI